MALNLELIPSGEPQGNSAPSAADRLTLICFSAPWSAACKRLEKTTWRDERVLGWIEQNAKLLTIDAETNLEIALENEIRAFPTLLVFSSTGEELNRLVGYRTPEEFLTAMRGIGAGDGQLELARQRAEIDGGKNPMARMSYGNALRANGDLEAALKEYLWCLDEGHKHDPPFAGVRQSLLPRLIAELGRHYPPAIQALRDRRDFLRETIHSSALAAKLVGELANLNRCLGEEDETLRIYDQLRKKDPDSEAVRTLCKDLFDTLCQARRFDEIVDGMDLVNRVRWETDIAKSVPRLAAAPRREHGNSMPPQIRLAIDSAVRYYAVLHASGRRAAAAAAAENILRLDFSAQTHHELARAAMLLADPNADTLDLALTAHEMCMGEDAEIGGTLARAYVSLNRIDEAQLLLADALARFDGDSHATGVIERCLDELNG